MLMENSLTKSLEDYLEAILLLEQEHRVARVKDIAHQLNVQMPSVTGALKSLKKKELIHYEKNSFIRLTEKGLTIAQSIYRRHEILLTFLEKILLLPHDKAEEAACKIEHTLDSATAHRIERLSGFLQASLLDSSQIPQEKWQAFLEDELDIDSLMDG